MAVAALAGLTACGSDGSDGADAEADPTVEDRQAFYSVRGTEICVGDGTYQNEMTLKFENSTNANGNGPFPLHGGWCGSNSLVIKGNVYDGAGSRIIYIGAGNPEIGYPQVTVTCRPDSKSDPRYVSTTHKFDDGETFSFPCDPYKVDVERESDSPEQKHFRVMVNPR